MTVRVDLAPAVGLGLEELLALYDAVGWSAYTREPARLAAAVAGSHRVVVARDDGGALVGMARAVSDGITICYVQDVLVHPGHQRSGVGRRLLDRLLAEYAGVRQKVLLTDTEPGQHAFYRRLGFTETRATEPAVRAFVRFDH